VPLSRKRKKSKISVEEDNKKEEVAGGTPLPRPAYPFSSERHRKLRKCGDGGEKPSSEGEVLWRRSAARRKNNERGLHCLSQKGHRGWGIFFSGREIKRRGERENRGKKAE